MKSTHKHSWTKKTKWCQTAHLVCVHLMSVANRSPILSQSSSRACSAAADSPLSQTAASATTAINYSLELCLLVYLWGWRPRPECMGECQVQITLPLQWGRESLDTCHVTAQPQTGNDIVLKVNGATQGGINNIIIMGVWASVSLPHRLTTN